MLAAKGAFFIKVTRHGAILFAMTDFVPGSHLELAETETSMTAANNLAVRRTLEAAGVEFIGENGGGPGVRLRKRQQLKLSGHESRSRRAK
jgi:hypothetical protein